MKGAELEIVPQMTSQHGRQKASRMDFAVIFSMSFNVSCSILGKKEQEPMREELVVGQDKTKSKPRAALWV